LIVPALDKELGMSVYATDSAGIGGAIRKSAEDFLVEEILVDSSVARIENTNRKPALGASSSKEAFLLCVLVKRNWDTFSAIKNIAKHLGIDQKRICIAGIKDAKAVTSQHITIQDVAVEDLKKIRHKDIEVCPLGYFRNDLSQFYLLGNQFTINVTDIKLSEPTIKRRVATTMKELEEKGGIPNFFGHQRFGTIRAITHRVGKAIIKDRLQEAAMLFLAEPSPYEHPESAAAREALKRSSDFAQAFHDFPKQLRFERLMLRYLAENPTDFAGAFQQLPFKLQVLFVQACQSHIFNRFLSERIQNGLPLNAAEIGDYVVHVDRSGLPMTKTGKLASEDKLTEINEAIRSGKMRVALPLVGFRQKLSEGQMGDLEARVMEEDGVEPASFRVPEIPRISGPGDLRTVVSPIRDFKLEHFHQNDESGKTSKVKMSFMLLRGSYATVLLRETMKPGDPLEAGF